MVNRNLLREYDLPDSELQLEYEQIFRRDDGAGDVNDWLPAEEQEFETNKIVTGRVINIVGDDVLVDVGYKSEGVIDLKEWYDEGVDKIVPPSS
jgi:small subunit ribosomal protein S1